MDDLGGSIIASLFLGVFLMGFTMDNLNSDFESVQANMLNAQEVCESANSVPVEIDRDDEVICANGAVMKYR